MQFLTKVPSLKNLCCQTLKINTIHNLLEMFDINNLTIYEKNIIDIIINFIDYFNFVHAKFFKFIFQIKKSLNKFLKRIFIIHQKINFLPFILNHY